MAINPLPPDEEATEETAGDTAPKRDEEASALFSFPDPSGKGWKQQEKDKAPSEPKPRGRPPGSRSSKTKVKKSVAQFYMGAGMLTMRFVDEYDGTVIIHNAEALTDETMKLAEQYPWVMSTLEQWTNVSAIGGMFAVLCAVGIPIMVNHEMLPEVALQFVDAPPLETDEEETES